MSQPAQVSTPTGPPVGQRPPRRRPRVIWGSAVVILAAIGAVLWVTAPFSSNAAAQSGVADNADPTSLATVAERSLSQQTQVSGTLGYAGTYSVVNRVQGTVTALPGLGQVVSQGQSVYSVDGSPVVLLYGSTPAYRSLSPGMSGSDVQQLNADLVVLGDATSAQLDPSSSSFSAATAAALATLQASLGIAPTGTLPLGEAVFLPSAIKIASVAATLGAAAPPGTAVLQATSTTRQVVVDLDTTQQTDVKVGDQVTITLPNDQITAGVVSAVGTIATTTSSSGSGAASSSGDGGSGGVPTIEVDITPSDSSATGSLDQAPVEVTITTASVTSALVVPVVALVALSGGGYAVEIQASSGIHHLVPVALGLFDDADGLVQVTGSGLSAGLQVVVPRL